MAPAARKAWRVVLRGFGALFSTSFGIDRGADLRSSIPDGASEDESQGKLEVPLRVGAAVRGRRDPSRVRIVVARDPDLRVGIAQVDVVEEIHDLDAHLDLLRARQPELLEQRRVGAP